MDMPSRADETLAQPSRAKLFELLTELRRPAGTEELAEQLALHPNGVRMHLERLLDAGLVSRERTPQGRGRPRDMWMIAADAQPGGDPPSAYADLGRWLSRVLAGGKASRRAIETAGREIGRDLVPADSNQPAEETVFTTLAALGFHPEREIEQPGRLTYKLCNCPYRDAASESQDVVCTLHRGITRGLLETVSPETRLERFVPRDPYAAGLHDRARRRHRRRGLPRSDGDSAVKRNPALTSLSHEHHQALFVAQKLRRATPATARAAREAFLEFWHREGCTHFRIEEDVLIPAYAGHGDAHHPLVARALCEHAEIRDLASRVDQDPGASPEALADLGRRLAEHVRLEERELFPMIEQALPGAALTVVAAQLAEAERLYASAHLA